MLRTDGRVVGGRLVEPHGIGFPLLLAPAYALGGATLVVVLLAAVAALAFVLAAALARRVVPDPWATWAALLTGLSPPVLAHATAVLPALTAGALLAGAALGALAVRERPLMRNAYVGAALLAVLPWLDPWLLVPAAPDHGAARALDRAPRPHARRVRDRRAAARVARLLRRAQRPPLRRLHAARGGRGARHRRELGGRLRRAAPAAGGALRRSRRRAAALGAGAGAGVPRRLAALALAARAARRGSCAEQRDAEHAAFLALAVCAGQVAVAVFVPRSLAGPWFPGTQLVAALPCAVPLVAWGLRHAPRVGLALGALTLGASLWLALTSTWAPPESDAPWGPLVVRVAGRGDAGAGGARVRRLVARAP